MDTLFHVFVGYLTLKRMDSKLQITKPMVLAIILGSYAPDFLTLFCYADTIIHGQMLSFLSNTGLWYYTKILHSMVFIPAILIIPAIFNVYIRIFLLGFILHILVDIPTHTIDTGYYLFPIIQNVTLNGLFAWSQFRTDSSILIINPITYLLWVIVSLFAISRHRIRKRGNKNATILVTRI